MRCIFSSVSVLCLDSRAAQAIELFIIRRRRFHRPEQNFSRLLPHSENIAGRFRLWWSACWESGGRFWRLRFARQKHAQFRWNRQRLVILPVLFLITNNLPQVFTKKSAKIAFFASQHAHFWCLKAFDATAHRFEATR